MMVFAAFVVSLLLLPNPARSSTLRSAPQDDRRLSYELIANYEPRSSVTDINAIDLDQAAMEDQLAIRNIEAWSNAENVYKNGGHSKSVAMITLSTPLAGALEKFTTVTGQNSAGATVYGQVYDDYANGATTVGIQYKVIDIQESYVECQVGGLVKQNIVGCFAADGKMTIDGKSYDYKYDPETANVNKRTLRKFSTDAESKMYRCEDCPHSTYQKFRDYYGFFDYADRWIMAAFDGHDTQLARGNANFAYYGWVGRDEAIKKGTAYMSVWMWVIKQMEDALSECESIKCEASGCNSGALRSWDEAVALYTGSLEGTDGSGSGKLLYGLADKRCQNFRTCGEQADSADGTSHVNINVIRNFAYGSRLIQEGMCAQAKPHKEHIEMLMAVPLIQGTLRYAYITSTDEKAGYKAEMEGATFAAAVLPLVYACDEDAANTIYKNMKTGQAGTASFPEVKTAFESVYSCMGIDPRAVGGLWNADTESYYYGAKPAGTSRSNSSKLLLIIGCVAGGLALCLILYAAASKCGNTGKALVGEKEDPLALSEEENNIGERDPEIVTAVNEEDPLPSTNSEMEPVEIS
mmetsp:Transcript_4355/g.12532  ORF Transcript_4355/g.12532 Transcript_4355/m.12532 type:complete len:579 (-) Transcript_4355:233-1969(-)